MVTQPALPLYRTPPPYARFSSAMEMEEAESTSTLPLLRSVLAPEYAVLPHMELVEFMESEYGEGAAEDYEAYLEGFFGDVGRFFKKAAPVVANIAGGVVKGATTGAPLGLPGIIGGAVAGGVGQGFASYGKGSLRKIGRTVNTGLGVASQFSPTGRIGGTVGTALSGIGQGKNVVKTALGAAGSLIPGAGAAGGNATVAALSSLIGGKGGNSASQLLSLLQRPEVLQALGAMAMGPNGRKTIPVGRGRRPVPATAFAGLLNRFAQNVLDEQAALSDGSESDLAYLMNDAGEWIVDPAESDERADLLFEMLNVAEAERMIQEAQIAEWQEAQLREMQERAWLESMEQDMWELEEEEEWFAAGEIEESLLFDEDIDEMSELLEYDDEAFLESLLLEDEGEYDELTFA